ncbi:MAG: tetratricopeptide repeat protein [Planctomycetota bacterium]
MTRTIAVLSLSCAVLLGACAAHVPPVPMDAFEAGDFARIEGFFQQQIDHGDGNSRALFLNGLAQAELLSGDHDAARRDFAEAGRIMGNWYTSGGETTAAIVGEEGSKTWKGDPHERAMNAFYLGVLYWWKGEPDNARAAFKAGILADAESDEGEAQVDFALLYWLAGRASLEMGLRGDAEQFFEEARKAREFAVKNGARGASSAPILTDPSHGNLIVLAELGLGPRKVPSGEYEELAVIEPHPVTFDRAEVFVDGESQGHTTLLADLDYQARTRGGHEMAGIRKGKAVFKDVTGNLGALILLEGANDRGRGQRDKLIVGGALLLASLLTRPDADVRFWETLPQTVHALTADVAPGRHEVRIVFSGPGRPSGLEQTWQVDVQDHRDTVLLFRSLPIAGPAPAPRT